MSGFVIHALSVSDGILAIAPMPGRGGHYVEDMAHLHDWRPALVMTMLSHPELRATGHQDIGADLQDMGTRWMHVPVPDMGVPGPEAEEAWHMASNAALSALQGKGRVLIHCMGGCGRSGMAALRLMIEAGEAPGAALERLRAVRPCAVETPEQLDWANRG
ncbi:protein phosphatase [Roseovarius sp. PS-C2]|uniref:protein-tyrosine phosphatase family protein n=1 Tax=Roseovarius sp. PS-C2 TaxID=2820814 RepID=UPI001C0DE01A|nr:protein-tyrosine phosphatase family protein [Roseovarius sp. PS-C2]MBU3260220.1 protein phosphatase [Roseovarius sp. PS-C2]